MFNGSNAVHETSMATNAVSGAQRWGVKPPIDMSKTSHSQLCEIVTETI